MTAKTLASCLDAHGGDYAAAWKDLFGATDADMEKARIMIESERPGVEGIFLHLMNNKPFTFAPFLRQAIALRDYILALPAADGEFIGAGDVAKATSVYGPLSSGMLISLLADRDLEIQSLRARVAKGEDA